MNKLHSLSVFIVVAGLATVAGRAVAHEDHDTAKMGEHAPAGHLVPITDKDGAWVAKAKAEYPTTTCLVSGEKLGGDMGDSIDYIYREEGKPDRLISFCCKDCVGNFNKNPQKYLKVLDAAKAPAKDKAPAEHHHSM